MEKGGRGERMGRRGKGNSDRAEKGLGEGKDYGLGCREEKWRREGGEEKEGAR